MNKVIQIWEWRNEYDTNMGFVVYKDEVSNDVVNALSVISTDYVHLYEEADHVYNFEHHFHVEPQLTEYTLSILELIGEVVHGEWTLSKHKKYYQ